MIKNYYNIKIYILISFNNLYKVTKKLFLEILITIKVGNIKVMHFCKTIKMYN
jgi:hypothetical protein